MTRVTLLLVCSLLTMDITLASYGSNLLNFIIRPAGRSRSFKWLGRGDTDNIPLFIPRPPFIPRWIPKERPEYVAKWVPTTPPPQVNRPPVHQPGFGAPKPNSVVNSQGPSAAYNPPAAAAAPPSLLPPPPPSYPSAPAPVPAPSPTYNAPAPVPAPSPTYNAPAPVPAPSPTYNAPAPVPAPAPTYNAPTAPTPQPSGYAPPRPDDIISGVKPAAAGPPPATGYTPPATSNVIPETAIRNTLQAGPTQAPVLLGEPSFSALVQDQASIDINGFRDVDPGSIIVIDEDDLEDELDDVNDLGSSFGVLNPAEAGSVVFIDDDSAETNVRVTSQIVASNEDDLLFIVIPEDDKTEDSFAPATSSLVLGDDGNLQTLGAKSLEGVETTLTAPFGDILLADDAGSDSDQSVFISIPDEVSENDQIFVVGQDIQTSGEFQPSQEFDESEGAVSGDGFLPSQDFLVDESLTNTASQSIQPGQNSLLSSNLSPESPTLEQLARPALLAPPATPVVASSRRAPPTSTFAAARSIEPSGRALPSVIPQPVPVPLISQGTVTLDLPQEGNFRQARLAAPPSLPFLNPPQSLPFGARLRPRHFIRPQSRAFFYG
ncbi:flocculation protein FLO11-like [Penaeus japonicus]|uniref:flocculation protein FLO11-like n=1 Tax=Penaeus japonicus TaxID=27405 RepID=UPI001C713B4A|nr:flocculation protein FLO11-like [Penaeus japonicus]